MSSEDKKESRWILAITLVALSILILLVSPANAKRLHKERYYQEKTCNGIMEFVLKDRTRVDCLTKEYAIEHDFANKWAEAIGQSLHYARLTGKKAAIMLIVEKPKDIKYYKRLLNNIDHYNLPITVWKIGEINYE